MRAVKKSLTQSEGPARKCHVLNSGNVMIIQRFAKAGPQALQPLID